MSTKYEAGDYITSLDECMEQKFIIFRGKVLHYGFFGSWQTRYLKSQIENRVIKKAILKEREEN